MERQDEIRDELWEELIGALVGLARATEGNEDKVTAQTDGLVAEALAATAETGCGGEVFQKLTARVRAEKKRMIPLCFCCASPCGRNQDYNMKGLRESEEAVRLLKLRILEKIQETAAAVCRKEKTEEEGHRFFYMALFALGRDDWGEAELLPVLEGMEEKSF